MATSLMGSLVQDLNEKLGDRPFYTLRELTSIGFFGSMPAARQALREGRLPFFKISPRRCVVSRQTVIEYLENNFVNK